MKCSKNKKAPGYGGINVELIKYSPTALRYGFLDMLNTCWRTGYLPEEWGVATVIPTYIQTRSSEKN
jgi:hypothetical protein